MSKPYILTHSMLNRETFGSSRFALERTLIAGGGGGGGEDGGGGGRGGEGQGRAISCRERRALKSFDFVVGKSARLYSG